MYYRDLASRVLITIQLISTFCQVTSCSETCSSSLNNSLQTIIKESFSCFSREPRFAFVGREMKVPLECQMLRLALQFVNSRSAGNWSHGAKALISDSVSMKDKFQLLEAEVDSTSFQGVTKNLYYVHADTEHKNGLQIHLKFFIPDTKSTYSETLSLSSESENRLEITDNTKDDFYKTEVDDLPITTALNGKTTSLDLLNVVIPFAIADALCDTAFHGPHLAEHVEAFGVKGKDIVLAFKQKFLGPQRLLEKPAYKLTDPFTVDLNQMKVTLGFECLIEKYLGRGTDFVYVNDKLLVEKIDVVRHSGKYTD